MVARLQRTGEIMPRIKWKTYMAAEDDRQQTKFTKTGKAKEPAKSIVTKTTERSLTEQYLCPFCLTPNQLQKYLVSTKKGISSSMAKCPSCGNSMRMNSLTANYTPEQYAEWVYAYAASGFWQKIPFNTFNKNLRKIGWSYRFWKRYKQLKGEDTETSYYEYLDEEQEKWAKKEGYI
jgi:transcription elongation factor Elf1